MQCNRTVFHQKFQLALWQSCNRYLNISPALQSKSVNNLVKKYWINNNESKKRKKFHQTNVLSNPSMLAQKQMKGEKDLHRLHVLNKVLMDKICDLLSTGEISSIFTGYGIEISKVQVMPKMAAINVHWFCTGSDVDGSLEKILHENAGSLRHELSQQRIIGRVPPIHFVKDHRYYKLMEVERRLAIADFGNDFEPSHYTQHVKSLVLKTDFDENIKNALEVSKEEDDCDFFLQALHLSSQSNETEDTIHEFPLDLPLMKDNVFGIETNKIFSAVKQAMTKAKAEHRKDPGLPLSISDHQEYMAVPIVSRTDEIRQWISKYADLRKKARQERHRDDALLRLPVTIEDKLEPIFYEEEEDFWDESFELDSQEDQTDQL